ncbi:hypothetical protein AB0J83_21795 [Actinoplanes sp. NPDC049596]|uniref:hypothetical protein n=1 Tax=unclassified Actinoplanes TaxID=2626549 RepID=UPI00341E2607
MSSIAVRLMETLALVPRKRACSARYLKNSTWVTEGVLAVLANLAATTDDEGLLQVAVPAVAARKPRTDREGSLSWTHSATPEATGTVAGFWPVLRQGWAYLDDDPDSALIRPGLPELAGELTTARFSTFPHAAGLRLAQLFGLTP